MMLALLACLLLIAPTPEAFGQRRRAQTHRRQVAAQPANSQKDLKTLINKLKAAGMRVGRSGVISQPFFSVKGQVIKINGEQVQVFEYPKAGTAEAEAKLVDPRGSSVGTNMMTWMAPPHFYKGGRLIVLYLGENPTVINALVGVMGPQFAGV